MPDFDTHSIRPIKGFSGEISEAVRVRTVRRDSSRRKRQTLCTDITIRKPVCTPRRSVEGVAVVYTIPTGRRFPARAKLQSSAPNQRIRHIRRLQLRGFDYLGLIFGGNRLGREKKQVTDLVARADHLGDKLFLRRETARWMQSGRTKKKTG
jgi:hypothetical protein